MFTAFIADHTHTVTTFRQRQSHAWITPLGQKNSKTGYNTVYNCNSEYMTDIHERTHTDDVQFVFIYQEW